MIVYPNTDHAGIIEYDHQKISPKGSELKGWLDGPTPVMLGAIHALRMVESTRSVRNLDDGFPRHLKTPEVMENEKFCHPGPDHDIIHPTSTNQHKHIP